MAGAVTLLVALLGLLILANPAQATFPGANGKIVYTIFLGDSYSEFDVVDPDGQNRMRLTDLDHQNTSPAWSPDGRAIAFQTNRYGGYDIAVIDADGTGLERLTTNDAVNGSPAWSPDGSKIAFSSSDLSGGRQGPSNIAVMNADGTGLALLTQNQGGFDSWEPAWSPDGSRIAFVTNGDLYVMNADGTEVTRLTNRTASGGFAGEPDWSPDGRRIAFRGERGQIFTMNPDGSDHFDLGVTAGRDPTWSPDGTRIALIACPNQCGIISLEPDGSGQAVIGAAAAADFDWQPLPSAPKSRPEKCKPGSRDQRCAPPLIREFPVSPYFGVGDITSGPDGALWFTADEAIGRITTSGRITMFPLPTGSSGSGITSGPDGALWFTEYRGKIGRITTSGTTTEFTVPTSREGSRVNPVAIAAGPDGALWFTVLFGDRIWRLTTGGAFTSFAIPSGRAFGGITAGPDEALWFTADRKIGRITTAGVVSEFDTPDWTPTQEITLGPDGALWFVTQNNGDYSGIGRITTNGAFTPYSLPSELSSVSDIAAGPDGALWFTVPSSWAVYPHFSRIGRITTSGSISEFTFDEFPAPHHVAAGPDGAVWFTEGANSIARIATAPRRADFKTAETYCDALRDYRGPSDAAATYRNFGQCVSHAR